MTSGRPTKRQQDYVKFMSKFFNENDQLPTIKVLAENFRCNLNCAWGHIRALEQKRIVERNAIGEWKRGPLFYWALGDLE
tara:strand:- start:46199 stop:46438 length:240 start_codon:yes stop_codon:yes gene_type:complete